MTLSSWQDWVTWAGVVLPLCTLCWAALQYNGVKKNEQRQRDFENFFVTVQRANNADKSLIAQLAAIYELRHYPQYREVIIRIADDASITFGVGDDHAVAREFKLTAEYLRRL